MAVKWEFYDPTDDTSYTFEINPNAGGSPQFTKKIQYQNTSGPGGAVIAFEGAQEPMSSQFEGVVLSQDQYDAMIAWFTKRHSIEYTDDLGRVFSIYITSFEPQRQRAVHHPWKHSYTVKYLILADITP